jgi:hypothetical protein
MVAEVFVLALRSQPAYLTAAMRLERSLAVSVRLKRLARWRDIKSLRAAGSPHLLVRARLSAVHQCAVV